MIDDEVLSSVPSAEQIAASCLEVQATWNESQRMKRADPTLHLCPSVRHDPARGVRIIPVAFLGGLARP